MKNLNNMSPGRADQYRAEALAVRKELGFSPDAEDVSPSDLVAAINNLRINATWTDEQCLEFLCVAFRHCEIKGDVVFDEIRQGVQFALAAASQPDQFRGVTKMASDKQPLRTLTINWLNKCPACGSKFHAVTTIDGTADRLFDGDDVRCKCGRIGTIQCLEGCAFVQWATDEELRDIAPSDKSKGGDHGTL
ncbi:hypothetical protein [Dickeya chrysanthemi]|uniref:hypothetical protein n=1 Tax=Dickeya chrysanthemi TaxID=556 RepID=UPI001CF241CE|nr:hypothetical protein [Dickeya chrysanthemi]MCA7008295.1 hypothetical protein [Dickeya chrysanthemi]